MCVTSCSRMGSRHLRQWRNEHITSGGDGALWWERCTHEGCNIFLSLPSSLNMAKVLVHDFLPKYICTSEHSSCWPRETTQQFRWLPAWQNPECCDLAEVHCRQASCSFSLLWASLSFMHQEKQACSFGHRWGFRRDQRGKVEAGGLQLPSCPMAHCNILAVSCRVTVQLLFTYWLY